MSPLRVAMITQALDEDDPILGFTVGWVRALAPHLDRLYVFCLRSARPALPANVEPRVTARCRASRYLGLCVSLRLLAKRDALDAILAHMCPRYAITASFAVPRHIPIAMWYAHSRASAQLRLAHRVCARVYSCSTESFPLASRKLEATGHGIDASMFRRSPLPRDDGLDLVAVGRIAPVKHLELLIEATALLRASSPTLTIRCRIVGTGTSRTDRAYEKRLCQRVRALGLEEAVSFVGPVAYRRVEEVYRGAHVLFSATPQSLDKSALEAMACGRLVLTTNDTLAPLFSKHAPLLLAKAEPDDVAAKLASLARLSNEEKEAIAHDLSAKVMANHNLDRLAERLARSLRDLVRRSARNERQEER